VGEPVPHRGKPKKQREAPALTRTAAKR